VVEEIGSLTTDRRAYQTTAHSVGHSAQKKEIKCRFKLGRADETVKSLKTTVFLG